MSTESNNNKIMHFADKPYITYPFSQHLEFRRRFLLKHGRTDEWTLLDDVRLQFHTATEEITAESAAIVRVKKSTIRVLSEDETQALRDSIKARMEKLRPEFEAIRNSGKGVKIDNTKRFKEAVVVD